MSIKSFAIYNKNTGEIDRVCHCHSDLVGLQCSDAEAYLPYVGNVSDLTHFVVGDVIKNKKPFSYKKTLTSLGVLLEGLPKGTRVSVGAQELIVREGTVKIEFDLPGTYKIQLSGSVSHLDETLEATVG